VFGSKTGLYFTKGYKEPASIIGWYYQPLAALWGLGAGISAYALGVKRYNVLWLVAPFVPLWITLFYNYVRQPN